MHFRNIAFFVFFAASCNTTIPSAGVKDTTIPVKGGTITEGPKVDLQCNKDDSHLKAALHIVEMIVCNQATFRRRFLPFS